MLQIFQCSFGEHLCSLRAIINDAAIRSNVVTEKCI